MIFNLDCALYEYPIVAFDTETSGPYPLESEVIELGAVKYKEGIVIERFQTLLKPCKPLLPDNIRIHGITNEMVENSPKMAQEILKFCEFIDGSVLLAHHAPFDLGFVALDIEAAGLSWPTTFNLCSSLISRALLPTTNHKLQTLIKELNLVGGAAHRAYDDAYACLQVLLKCTEKLSAPVSLGSLAAIQKKDLNWQNYSLSSSGSVTLKTLANAIQQEKSVYIVYDGGQTKSKPRPIRPFGIVRNPDGDYVHAECRLDFQRKRFYIDKIKSIELT